MIASDEIVRCFELNFYPRQSKLNEQRILVLYGPPCAGKTTVATQIAAKYNFHFVSMDQLRSHYKISDLFTNMNNAEVLNIFLREVRFLAENKQSVICEGMFYSEERKQQLKKYLEPFKLDFFYFKASLDILLHRLDTRNIAGLKDGASFGNTLTPELLVFYFNKFSMPPKDVYTIDTGKTAVSNTIKIISEKFLKAKF